MRWEKAVTTSGLLSSGSHWRSPAAGACMTVSHELGRELTKTCLFFSRFTIGVWGAYSGGQRGSRSKA